MRSYLKYLRNRRASDDRGAAIVEFAIAIPLFIALLLVVFDAGLGYSASRTSSSAARSAARVGALAGDARNTDFRILDTLRSDYGNALADGDGLARIIVFRSDPTNANGAPPAGCGEQSIENVCNSYDAAILGSLASETFASVTLPDGSVTCTPSAPDAAWCPLNRRSDAGAFLGVYISSVHDTTTGIDSRVFNLEDRAVFALYFEPL
ncbi:MAG: TadE/TadG family type IV pilus assembly protein [Acidimicrobiales bacterium]|jgi:Flp pilus assembly protein TadG